MRTTLFHIFGLLAAAGLALSGCNLPVSSPVTETAAYPTQAVINIEPADPVTPQVTDTPTGTPTTASTETSSPEPSATATVELPKAKINRETNCRVGPGGLYDLVATYQAGQVLEVVAKDLGSAYWFIRNPEKPEEQCYVMAQNVTIDGDTSALPKFTPRPSPTPPPYFEAAFKKFENCNGNRFANFIVENTGSVTFRSAYIKVTDTKASKSVEQALNVFDQYVGCTLAKDISPLDPGQTGYVPAPPFTWNFHEDKLQAALMLCSEKDLKGICVTRTVDVKK